MKVFEDISSPWREVACVAGVRKGRGRELGRETAREGGGRRVPFLSPSRAQIPPSPSPFNACYEG